MDRALAPVVEPICESFGLELYDLDRSSQIVRVLVDRDGGVDLDTIGSLTRALSERFDELDLGSGRYTLEVSSPGVERRLRTEAHFVRAIGETVTVKMVAGEPIRRVDGLLESVADGQITVRNADGTTTVAIDAIDRARTVFEWGAVKKPSPSKATKPSGSKQAQQEEGTL